MECNSLACCGLKISINQFFSRRSTFPIKHRGKLWFSSHKGGKCMGANIALDALDFDTNYFKAISVAPLSQGVIKSGISDVIPNKTTKGCVSTWNQTTVVPLHRLSILTTLCLPWKFCWLIGSLAFLVLNWEGVHLNWWPSGHLVSLSPSYATTRQEAVRGGHLCYSSSFHC